MPRNITVTFEDGSTHVYQNAPDDVTPESVSSRAAKDFGKTVASLDGGRSQDSAARPSKLTMLKEEALSSLPAKMLGIRQYISGDPAQIAAAPPTRFAVGAASPIIGIADRIAGDSGVRQSFNALAQEGGAGTDVAGMAGTVMSPLTLAAGKHIPLAKTAVGKMAQGGAYGGVGGLLAPAETFREASGNALAGLGLGAMIPAAIMGSSKVAEWGMNKIARPTMDLFTKQGPSNILGRFIVNKVGEKNMPAVLAKTGSVQPILPGGKPTVGQAVAGLPEGSPIQALQEVSARQPGGASAVFGQRAIDQQSAIEAAKAARKVASDFNYGKAFDPKLHQVKPDAELQAIAENPLFQQATAKADLLARAKGITPEDNLTEILHYVKVGLDKRLRGGMGEVPIDNAERAAITDVKNRLVKWLAKNNKDYETGRSAYAAASKDIDAFMERIKLAENPLQRTNVGNANTISESGGPHLANMLSRPIMATNWAMRLARSNIESEIDELAALRFSDPAEFTRVMQSLPKPLQFRVDTALRNANALSFASGASQ